MRTRWTWASWVLLFVTLAGGGLAAWPKKDGRVASSRALIEGVVAGLKGKSKEQTELIGGLLRQVLLESVPVEEALDTLKLPSSPKWIRQQLVARARHLFLERVSTLKSELDDYVQRLT